MESRLPENILPRQKLISKSQWIFVPFRSTVYPLFQLKLSNVSAVRRGFDSLYILTEKPGHLHL